MAFYKIKKVVGVAVLILRKEFCYSALALCILTNLTPEQAFERLDPPGAKPKNRLLTREDTEDMIEMRKTMDYGQIAECYGISKSAVFSRIKRYNKKVAG